VTRGHVYDQAVLEWAITTDAKYIGMIGSRKKNRKIFDNLIAKGVAKDDLKRVHASIGLDINAVTPEEISISIMAEIIKIRRSKEAKGKSVRCPA
jgi:xanthine dehydrogenase accessory factor